LAGLLSVLACSALDAVENAIKNKTSNARHRDDHRMTIEDLLVKSKNR